MSTKPATDGKLTASTTAQWANALKTADTAFKLLTTGPRPLALDGRDLGHGLPAREIDLAELRDRLLSKSATDALKDAVWAELVTRARSGDPAWVIGCVGVAMPGLKAVAGRAVQTSPVHCIDDIVSEMLTEFVAQLAHIDIQRPNIAPRLLFWARKGALRVRARERRHLACDPLQMPAGPNIPEKAGPETVLKEAVNQDIISPASASLIAATRLNGRSVKDVALEQGIPAHHLYRQRKAAEKALLNAIRTGQLSVTHLD
ncbi:hypothetical protein Acsp04_61230 [Actinomadura sp. NBRC 104425]|uniref:hypothetical protein n=1 Tax=Actinomadura sp. NBRC 104425 TaxID=3032204 RepID=UPI00249FAD37|nr:hypothetical protein [Actinomadura sp. NBRC 104425]GLZ15888.1 hypothetical protein Acsp04_61230 [Actinomadura sp. NBRC 104425]